jgi:hypothetical protein
MEHDHPRGGASPGRRDNGGGEFDEPNPDIEELRARLGEMTERVVEVIRARPGTSLLLALGAGFLIGRILRS